MSTIEFNERLISLMTKLEYFAQQLTSDREDAKDLLQETVFKALRNREKFQPHGNFKAWLYTIMKNTFINSYRRSLKKGKWHDQTAEEYFYNFQSSGSYPSPESDYNKEEIENTINDLSENYRVPFVRYNSGYKYEEIAQELNLPIGTVKSRIFLARKRLMEKLKGI